MPTGYTACLIESASFEKFAMGCARAFGALITLRDEPGGKSFDEQLALLDADHARTVERHTNKIKSACEALSALHAMSTSEVSRACDAANVARLRDYEVSLLEMDKTRERYKEALKQAKSWTPPTNDHQQFKLFMVEQIESSLKFDIFDLSAPTKLTREEWHTEAIKKCQRDIKYYTEGLEAEIKRHESRRTWLIALVNSFK